MRQVLSRSCKSCPCLHRATVRTKGGHSEDNESKFKGVSLTSSRTIVGKRSAERLKLVERLIASNNISLTGDLPKVQGQDKIRSCVMSMKTKTAQQRQCPWLKKMVDPVYCEGGEGGHLLLVSSVDSHDREGGLQTNLQNLSNGPVTW